MLILTFFSLHFILLLCLISYSQLADGFSMMVKTAKTTPTQPTTSQPSTRTTKGSTPTKSTTMTATSMLPTISPENLNSSDAVNGTSPSSTSNNGTFTASLIGNDSLLNGLNTTKASHWVESSESEESVEFLETVNGDKLVIEVDTPWNTHVGDDNAEATE